MWLRLLLRAGRVYRHDSLDLLFRHYYKNSRS